MSTGPSKRNVPQPKPDIKNDESYDWIKNPRTIQEWLAVFTLETFEGYQAGLLVRFMVNRTKSELLVSQSLGLIGQVNKTLAITMKAHSKRAEAMVRQLLHHEANQPELAASLETYIEGGKEEIVNALDKSNVVANMPTGDKRNEYTKSKVPSDYKK
jgi:hypothetical protein